MEPSHSLPPAQEFRVQILQRCSPACPITSNYNCSIIREISQAHDSVNVLASPICYLHRDYLLKWLRSRRHPQNPMVLFILYGLGYSRHYSRSDTPADSLDFDTADMTDFPPLPNRNRNMSTAANSQS
ncbi:hypothetical protein PTNB29_07371 [Pyrenophora teres f. teres]|nr:hypothetical protein PTNB29_07371 [Pyrenophora teres f. teres]